MEDETISSFQSTVISTEIYLSKSCETYNFNPKEINATKIQSPKILLFQLRIKR